MVPGYGDKSPWGQQVVLVTSLPIVGCNALEFTKGKEIYVQGTSRGEAHRTRRDRGGSWKE